MKTFTSIALLLLFVQIACAQSPASPQEAKQLLAQAQTLFNSSQYQACQTQAEALFRYFQGSAEQSPSELAAAANLVGQASFSLKQFEKAVSWFETTIQAWTAQFPEGSLQATEAWLDLGASLARAQKQEEALKAYQQNLALNLALKPQNHCKLSRTQRLIGNTHMELGHYTIAISHYEQALSMSMVCTGPESIQTADVLCNIGKAYLRNGYYDKALSAQEKALLIRQKNLPPIHQDLSESYMDIGEIYQKLDAFEKALGYYEKALENYRVNADSKEIDIAHAYNEIAKYFTSKKEYSKALDYLNRCNEIMLRNKYDQNAAYAYVCANFGSVYLGKKEYPLAIEWYEKMVEIWRNTNPHPNTQLGSMLTHLGRAKLTAEQFEAAKPVFEEAKQVYESILGSTHPLTSKADLWLGNTYRKWYLKTNQDSLLNLGREHYKMAVNGVEAQLLKEHTQTGQKKALAESMPVLERAISAEVIAYNSAHPSPEMLERAWQLNEAAHAYLLLSATKEVNARRFAGIPEVELNKDSVLQAQIASLQLERKALLESGLSQTDSLVLAQNIAIYTKKEAAQDLISYYEAKYPDYYRLKYQLQTSTLKETQQRLSSQQTLLEYFVGDFEIFILLLQQDTCQVLAIPRDFPIKDWTLALRDGISAYHTSKQKTPEFYQQTVLQYADAAQKLYGKLIAPIAESLTPELIIVPFEGLAHIPFEALLSGAPRDPGNFGTYPFLIQKHSVQYAYSATMLYQMTDRKHPQKTKGGLLAFAPFFEKDTTGLTLRLWKDDSLRAGFSSLLYSGEEIIRAKGRFGKNADLYFGSEASKKQFQGKAAKYQVLHLATHGKANQAAGEFSYLAFSINPTIGKNELLTVAEIYNLPINADLVILSACETGIGEQQKGEGVISLARAFAYAGAKSIVASLWSVNDQSTMQIMDHFYGELKAGKAKNIALASAKRNYLAQNPGKQAHPFFWAAFIGLGDMTPINN